MARKVEAEIGAETGSGAERKTASPSAAEMKVVGLRRGRGRCKGAGLTELGILIGVVAVLAVAAASTLGKKVSNVFGGSGNAISLSQQGLQPTGGMGFVLAGGLGGNLAPGITTLAGPVVSVRPLQAAGALMGLSAVDPNGDPLYWSSTGLPAWAALSAGGTLSLLSPPPAAASTLSFPFTAMVSDGQGGSDSRSFSIFVVNSPPAIATSSIPASVVGTAYSTSLSASDPDGDAVSWSVASGATPAGLSLDGASGSISGTPTAAGPWAFTAQASDGRGGTASQAFSGSALGSVSWSGSTLPAGAAGSPYSAQLPAAVLSGGGALSYSVSSGLPAGLSFDASTRTVSGTPTATAVGSQTLSASALGSLGGSATASFPLSISAAAFSAWTGTTLAAATQGTAYSTAIPPPSFASGGGTISYAFASGTMPPGLSLSSSGTLSGTPTDAGDWDIGIAASGSFGGSASATFHLSAASSCASPNVLYQGVCMTADQYGQATCTDPGYWWISANLGYYSCRPVPNSGMDASTCWSYGYRTSTKTGCHWP